MLIPTIVMGVMAVTLLVIGYNRGDGEHVTGLKTSLSLLVEILPLLIFAFITAGMFQVLMPKELVSKWVGAESGFKGIMIGSLAGILTPGGPFVILPMTAGFLHAGAGVGTMVAYLTGWALLSVVRLPMEVGIVGWNFTLMRLGCTFFFPPLAGLLAHYMFGTIKQV